MPTRKSTLGAQCISGDAHARGKFVAHPGPASATIMASAASCSQPRDESGAATRSGDGTQASSPSEAAAPRLSSREAEMKRRAGSCSSVPGRCPVNSETGAGFMRMPSTTWCPSVAPRRRRRLTQTSPRCRWLSATASSPLLLRSGNRGAAQTAIGAGPSSPRTGECCSTGVRCCTAALMEAASTPPPKRYACTKLRAQRRSALDDSSCPSRANASAMLSGSGSLSPRRAPLGRLASDMTTPTTHLAQHGHEAPAPRCRPGSSSPRPSNQCPDSRPCPPRRRPLPDRPSANRGASRQRGARRRHAPARRDPGPQARWKRSVAHRARRARGVHRACYGENERAMQTKVDNTD